MSIKDKKALVMYAPPETISKIDEFSKMLSLSRSAGAEFLLDFALGEYEEFKKAPGNKKYLDKELSKALRSALATTLGVKLESIDRVVMHE
jgi:hypothetical protein